MKIINKIAIGLILGIGLMLLTLQGVDYNTILTSISNLNYIYLFLIITCMLIIPLFRTYRLKLILSPISNISFFDLLSYNCFGYFVIILLPFRIGEFIIPYLINKNYKVSFGSAVSMIVVERVIDLFILVGLLFFLIFNFILPEWLLKSGYFVGSGLVIALVTFVIFYKYHQLIWKILYPLFNYLPEHFHIKIKNLILGFKEGFKIIHHPFKLFIVIFISLIVWLISALTVYFCFKFVNIDLEIVQATTVMVINTIGVSIPVSPGLIGNFQYSILIALDIYNIDRSISFVFANIYYIIIILLTIFEGMIFMPFVKLQIPDFKSLIRNEKNE